jgi:hypothetical protein
MDELRRDLREVFERQQAGLGSLAGVRQRIVREAVAPRRRAARRLVGLAAGIATLLIAAALVATLLQLRASTQPIPSTTHPPSPIPSVVPSPTALAPTAPLTRPLQVDAATPVILFRDPGNPDQVDGITWDGRVAGRVGDGARSGFVPDPTGTRYATLGAHDIRDRSGRVVATWDAGTKAFGAWADDSQHYCQIAAPATLQLIQPGQQPRTVASLSPPASDQVGTSVAACGVRQDRAVVVRTGPSGNATQMWVIQLSTGRVLWTHSYTSGDSYEVHASLDGGYVAEVRIHQQQPSPLVTTTMYNESDGSLVTDLTVGVNALSADGSLEVNDTAGPVAQVTVFQWHSGQKWTSPAGMRFIAAIPEPGGTGIAVALEHVGATQAGGFPTVDVIVVRPDQPNAPAHPVLANVSL